MIAALLLLACGSAPSAGDVCTAERPCGWGQTCVAGSCVDTACATSAQCPIETFCLEGRCVDGCRQESDCGPGRTCDLLLQECVDAGCIDTQLDCGFREVCDTTTGTCYDAGEQYCRPCQQSVQCGEGNVCFQGYCGVDCNDSECPAGFDCLAFRNGQGQITSFQCVTYCWLYE
ncbi:MAG: hypothetical protein H6734_09220 [Alphaproteobacteria bacterium]|nr:hypothetical protein [Alphaproteobacteria bacterium]